MSDDVEHTPAPWKVSDDAGGFVIAAKANGGFYQVADCGRDPSIQDAEREANARLIAAAPTMRERLLRLHSMLSWYMRPDVDRPPTEEEIEEMLKWSEDAIAKAEGRNE